MRSADRRAGSAHERHRFIVGRRDEVSLHRSNIKAAGGIAKRLTDMKPLVIRGYGGELDHLRGRARRQIGQIVDKAAHNEGLRIRAVHQDAAFREHELHTFHRRTLVNQFRESRFSYRVVCYLLRLRFGRGQTRLATPIEWNEYKAYTWHRMPNPLVLFLRVLLMKN